MKMMKNGPATGKDTVLHVRGESMFIDDRPLPEGLLYGAVLTSPIAKGKIVALDVEKARCEPEVYGVFTAADIPGENQIGGIIPDEPLFAAEELHFIGQPIGFVVADSVGTAKRAVRKINLETMSEDPVLDPREAYRRGMIIGSQRVFTLGDVDSAWETCDVVVSGRVDSGGQEHLYLETQGALAVAREDGSIKVYSATQSPTLVQKVVARVLDRAMHRVEIEVGRLGGAFGGKEDQATAWACMTALASSTLRRPVKLVLNRQEDIRITGKRHPYSSDFRMGLQKDGSIVAYEVTYYQNAGASADLSTAILERSMFHATGSYFIPNVKATGSCCKTNMVPNTAFRGFGGPQAMVVIETAIVQAASAVGMTPAAVQRKNLIQDGDVFPYGMKVRNSQAVRCFDEASQRYSTAAWRQRIDAFNEKNTFVKKGLAAMPVCFGISFTNTTLNQAGALVHVYGDGSVGVSTGAVEMGQGVKQKIVQVAASLFSLDTERVRVESTNTTRVANTSPTAASTGADLNGKAVEQACLAIRERLLRLAKEILKGKSLEGVQTDGAETASIIDGSVWSGEERTDVTWEQLVQTAYQRRINLSAQAHYATPDIYFDSNKEKGEPFAYHAYGTAFVEVTLDCLKGTYTFDAVKAVHDAGISLNPVIDVGQCEGGIVQGLGWLTIEELLYTETGRLMADSLSNYKIPDMPSAPKAIDVYFLEDSENPMGIFNSKAIGEPPFMYGIAGFTALLDAMGSFLRSRNRPLPWTGEGSRTTSPFSPEARQSTAAVSTPLTPEKVLLLLYSDELPQLNPRSKQHG